jgi:hypothetical protein
MEETRESEVVAYFKVLLAISPGETRGNRERLHDYKPRWVEDVLENGSQEQMTDGSVESVTVLTLPASWRAVSYKAARERTEHLPETRRNTQDNIPAANISGKN